MKTYKSINHDNIVIIVDSKSWTLTSITIADNNSTVFNHANLINYKPESMLIEQLLEQSSGIKYKEITKDEFCEFMNKNNVNQKITSYLSMITDFLTS
jgi:hypothetical protein